MSKPTMNDDLTAEELDEYYDGLIQMNEDMVTNTDELREFKKDKHVLKFMRKYRYQYHVTMLPDLALLVKSAYLEGYNNGLHQYPVTDSQPIKSTLNGEVAE